jgi:UDP-N-acetylmuramoylalanine--D-glutamate ligase
VAALSDLTIEYVLGGHPLTLLDGADLLCLSGGVDANSPLAVEARRRGLALSNDSQIFLEECPAGVATAGITGSAGKTTTTTLAGRMCGAHAWVGGNIGHPLIADLERMRAGDTVVMELSSFQLEIMTRSPRVGAVLNITPNHLDRHGTMEAYTAAKSQLLLHQMPDDVAVLGRDDAGSRALAPLARGRVTWFSGAEAVEQGAFARAGEIILRGEGREQSVAPVSAVRLRGRHNLLNVLAACAISGAAGAAPEAMRAAIEAFTGVEHRLEFVRERAGVEWYNDSIASAPERVIAALQSFDEPLLLLLGGRDKKLPWDALARLARQRAKHVVLFGEAAELIERALQQAGMPRDQVTRVGPLAEAVSVAEARAAAGEVVLLSPGCTSFDEFKDFAERGEQFKKMVREL